MAIGKNINKYYNNKKLNWQKVYSIEKKNKLEKTKYLKFQLNP